MPSPLFANLQVDGRVPPQPLTNQEWDSERYERAVRFVYRGIADTRVGSLVLLQFNQMVTIRPWLSVTARVSTADVHFTNTAQRTLGWRRATVRGATQHFCGDAPRTVDVDETGQPIPGASAGIGLGTRAQIYFWPQRYPDPEFPRLVPPARHNPPPPQMHAYADIALVHEMVHAAQMTQGVLFCRAAGFQYDTFAEFCAITVQNMYASERGYNPIAHHHGWEMRTDESILGMSASPRMREEASMLDRFRQLMPPFVQALERAPVRYNPFRQQLQWRRTYGEDLGGRLF